MSAYTLFANAFLAVGGSVVALFAIGAVLALGFHLYLAFEGFVAAKFAEDAFGHDADGDWPHVPSDLTVNNVFHNGTDTTRGRNDHA